MILPNTATLILLSWFLLAAHHVHHASAAKRSTYIVHMDKLSMPKPFSTSHHWYSSILKSVISPENPFPNNHIYTYDHAFHGFSVVLSKTELAALKNSPGFLSAHADEAITPHTTHSTKFLSLNPDTGIWPASHYGKDVIIGVVDTGIWPESPSFHDHGMTEIPASWKGSCQPDVEFNSSFCNKKIIGARYFNKGIRAESTTDISTIQDSARDGEGHGTHVASIAGGNFVKDVSFFGYAPGVARGVAPRARIAVYKVIWPGCVSSDILAGIDQAVADGVDIISISLGAEEVNLYKNPLSIASFGAREKGILVTLSAGNKGPGVGTIGSGIPWAVVVASGTVDRWFAGTLTLGNGSTITGWTTFPGRDVISNMPLFYNRALSACDSNELLSNAPDQSIIICDLSVSHTGFKGVRGNLSHSQIRAAIVVADEPSVYRSNLFPFPGVVISHAEACVVIEYMKNSNTPPIATIDFHQTILGPRSPRPAPALSDSSSRGPGQSYEPILKPDLMAPGVLILAAFNPHVAGPRIGKTDLYTNYTLISGTSMACPHVSGLAALLKAAHPNWSPAAIQSAMMTTANPMDNTNKPIKDMAFGYTAASPLGIGSGMINPNRALDPGLVYDASTQDLVDLVCSMNFTREHTQTIVRSSYNCSNPSWDLNYPSFVATFNADERRMKLTRRFRRTVTNVGSNATTYRVEVVEPVDTRIMIKPQTLVFREKYEKQSYLLTISYRADFETQHRDGYITWIEDKGEHTVRSPIMVSAVH